MIPRTLFAEEHEIFRESVRRFVEAEIVPHHGQWEKDGIVPREVWLKAGEAGLLCCNLSTEYGGMGGDFLHGTIVTEEFARVGATGPGFGLHSDIVTPYLVHYGTEAQKKEWLPRMARGEVIGAVGMTEPATGSDLQNITTRADRDGDEYVINGQKLYITNGQNVDLLFLACKTDPKAGAKGVSMILVEGDREGFVKGRNLDKIGMHAQDTSELFFSDLRVPVGNRLGEEGKGFVYLMQQLAQERLVVATRNATAIEAALDWTVDFTKNRKAFGKPIAEFQNSRFKLAEVKTQATVTRVFVDRCIELHMAGKLDAVDAAMAKMWASELLCRVLDECLQLHGGAGYMWEYPIARAYADARMSRIAGGTSEIMKEIIGRTL